MILTDKNHLTSHWMKLGYANICPSSLFFSFVLEKIVWIQFCFKDRVIQCQCVQCLCGPQCHQSPDCDIRTSLCSPPVNKMSMCLRGLLTMFKEIRKLRISHTADRIFIGLFTLMLHKVSFIRIKSRGKPLAERNVLAVIEMSIFR